MSSPRIGLRVNLKNRRGGLNVTSLPRMPGSLSVSVTRAGLVIVEKPTLMMLSSRIGSSLPAFLTINASQRTGYGFSAR
jgi:hypothetical protein